MEEKVCFRRFGTMIDCSRNAVMTVQSLKKWIDLTKDLGYNTLLLYTEDTYEVDDNPYFGYMRGRYSQKELKEINDYALAKGMEVIPCIQTLAHLGTITRWPDYTPHVDTGDILLAGDEKVYELIDKMFASISKCYTSRMVNIGMDEAHMIGRGKYYNLHGDTDRFEILVNHLNRVVEIGRKYGFKFTIWADMFFRLATGGQYESHDVSQTQISAEIAKQIPEDVELIYWDYYYDTKERYDGMLKAHQKIKQNTWFAGGLYSWNGYAPYNGFSIRNTIPAIQSCIEQGVQDVILTTWADDAAGCSMFAMIPALFYASELAKGNMDEKSIKTKFKDKFGVSFERFMLLDMPQSPRQKNLLYNPEKYLLFNDCFVGLLDSTIAGGENEKFASCSRQLSRMKHTPEWGYLFETLQALSDVLAIKAELGVKTRDVYHSKERERLQELILDYKKLQKRVQVFYNVYRRQWLKENKAHGFEVQDVRLGGLMCRIKNCTDRLQDLYDGKISIIDELEEKQLDYCGGGDKLTHELTLCAHWKLAVTVNYLGLEP